MIFLLSKQALKKNILKVEIQILTLLWFTGEIVVNSIAKFRGYHVVVIIKFIIFWTLIHSLLQKKKNTFDINTRKYDLDFDNIKSKGIKV